MSRALIGVFVGFLLIACGDGNVVIAPDPAVQLKEDSIAIAEYLTGKGFSEGQIGHTPNGVQYVILDSGSGDPIDESDIVTFDYTGMLLNDTIFDTTIKAVGDSIRAHFLEDSVGLADKSVHELFLSSFSENREYSPLEIIYTGTGWNIQGRFINGFVEGISKTFNKLKVGGGVLIGIPSGQAYGTNGSGVLIPPNTPIAFELYPTKVIKQ